LPWPADKPFRILSIDGGGIRGILPAALLTEFEAGLPEGRSSGDYFDMIAGTSTGGIIALGLSIGLKASDILQVYMEHGEEIFPPTRPPFRRIKAKLRFIRSLSRYQYEREPLERHLRKVFGHRQFGEAQRRLCIPSFDGSTEVNVFKTPHHPDFKLDWREQMVTIALATSAAPTFFSVYLNNDRRFADGGVWANNPTMVALVDALTCYDLDRRQVQILSLGCGESEMYITDRQVHLGGLWHWRDIISAAMRLAGQNALGQAGLLIGRDQLLRIDAPPVHESPIELDDFDRAGKELPPIAAQLASAHYEAVKVKFFTEAAEPYSAFYGPRGAEASVSDADRSN
jgi:patatin-like phospholipase/acyl hydrolase